MQDHVLFVPGYKQMLIVTIAFESLLYLQVKVFARFSHKMKTIEQQEIQLGGLLDAVPDSVYICTKGGIDKAPKGIYANFKMNQFFGRRVVTDSKEQKKEAKSLQVKLNEWRKPVTKS